ncbi:MAG: DUF5615 family PIN-like protein [Verrucomicrobia bacterium]|nr:DUF5615 family PIN-like protein [Verrucomicrobiota bacterium]
MDVHVPLAVTLQLRQRAVDVVTAIEDGQTETADFHLLARSTELSRVLVTQDIRFKALAESWQRENRSFSGMVFAHQLFVTVGRMVVDLELVAKASNNQDMDSQILHLPLG